MAATVLIVDDEKGVREGLVRAVASRGHRTVPVASLAEARAALDREEIDCVLLDIRLKDGDGLDLLRELRAGVHRELPVIMATAFGDSERTIQAMRAGAFEYITKPFDLPTLLDSIDRAVRKRNLGPPGLVDARRRGRAGSAHRSERADARRVEGHRARGRVRCARARRG